MVSRSKPGSSSFSAAIFSAPVRKSAPSVHLLKTNLMSKAPASARLDLGERGVGEALGAQRRGVDAGRLAERGVADGVGHDLGDLRLAVAERAQRLGHGAVDDLEIAAAGELLELHQREVGLDAGGVAIHHQADGAGRRDDRDLRVAIAVPLAERRARRPRRRAAPLRGRPRRRRPCRARHGRAGSARPTAPRSRRRAPSAARLWLRMTRSIALALGAWPGKAPSLAAISAEVA